MQLGLVYLAIALFILLALLKSKGCVRIAYKAVLRVDVIGLPSAWCLTRKVAQVNLAHLQMGKRTLQNRLTIQLSAQRILQNCGFIPQYLRLYAGNSDSKVYRIPKSNDFWTILGYYAVYSSNSLPTFRDNLSVTSSRVKRFLLGFLDLWR